MYDITQGERKGITGGRGLKIVQICVMSFKNVPKGYLLIFFYFPFAGLHKQLGTKGCIHLFSKTINYSCLTFNKKSIAGHKITKQKIF